MKIKNIISKTILISLAVLGMLAIAFTKSSSLSAYFSTETVPASTSVPSSKKAVALFEKIRKSSDSNTMIRYNYSLEYEYDDSAKSIENIKGVVYKKRNFNLDSNEIQLTFNDNNDFLSINHRVQLAVYSNLKELRKSALKNRANTQVDSLKIHFQKIHSLDFSDSLVTYFIAKDRSYENEDRIVIDVDFIEECPLTKYYVSFDKRRQLPDSMIVAMIQPDNVDVADDEMNSTEDATYYNDLISSQSVITFRAFQFIKGKFPVEKLIKEYVATKGNKTYLVRNKDYNLTVLK